MAWSIRAQSSAVRVIGPVQSTENVRGAVPARLTRPNVGLRPTTPHMAAGMRTDPPASPPSAPKAARAATHAPEPPDEPPLMRSVSQGLRVRP